MALAAVTTDLSAFHSSMAVGVDRRYAVLESISLTNDAATTSEIDYRAYGSGTIMVPNGSSITGLTFHSGEQFGGTYEQVYDDTNTALARTVAADRSYRLPVELAGVHWLKIVANAAGVVDITLKT